MLGSATDDSEQRVGGRETNESSRCVFGGRAMSLETYRYYRLDGVGHLHGAEWFEAPSDEDAIGQVEVMHPDGMCEIWQGARLVAKLSPRRLQA